MGKLPRLYLSTPPFHQSTTPMVAEKVIVKKAAMKVMKKKRVSKVAKGRFAKVLVFKGSREKTVGGLTKESLMKNKRGKIVSKRQNAQGKRAFKNVETWQEAFMQAREMLRVEGFHAINGKTLQGKALYYKTKALRTANEARKAAAAAGIKDHDITA